jgi:hypothetical protein
MRYNQLLALPFAAGLLSGAAGLAMAATSNAVTVEPATSGFVAAAAPAAVPHFVQLADESRGLFDRGDRGEGEGDGHQGEDRASRPHR